MKQGGTLEIEFSNPDTYTHHAAFLPSNGSRVVLNLPSLEKGRARIELDGPGLYWFGCPISNHAGRGMLGLVLVGGEVPDEAKLDRPKQKRP
jgi:PQQ system protein